MFLYCFDPEWIVFMNFQSDTTGGDKESFHNRTKWTLISNQIVRNISLHFIFVLVYCPKWPLLIKNLSATIPKHVFVIIETVKRGFLVCIRVNATWCPFNIITGYIATRRRLLIFCFDLEARPILEFLFDGFDVKWNEKILSRILQKIWHFWM